MNAFNQQVSRNYQLVSGRGTDDSRIVTDPELRAPGATGEVLLDQVKLGSHSAHFSFAQHHGKLVQHAIDKFVAVDAAINLG